MKTKIYAAYGSNMNIDQMLMRCPRATNIGTATLKNYKLTFRGGSRGVANIERCIGREVPIVLWRITERCEETLDVYEGFPRLYTKETIKVENGLQGHKVTCMAYIMAQKYEAMPAMPMDYYYSTIAQGYEDHGIDLKTLDDAYSECYEETREGKE